MHHTSTVWRRISQSLMVLAFCIAPGRAIASQGTIDVLILGDVASEHAHNLQAQRSDTVNGGLNEPARRLLPTDPVSFEGGTIGFSLKVDGERQNYITAKLWGSDKGTECGRLILFADGLQVGYRHEGDYDVLNQTDEEAEAPGRFIYQTVPLPMSITRGKSSVPMSILALGPMWPYGTTFSQYQKDLTAPSRGIYRVYCGTESCFTPDISEKQGETPPKSIRTSPGEEVIEKTRKIVNNRISSLLSKPPAINVQHDSREHFARMLLLAEAYSTPWCVARNDPRVIQLLLRDADAVAAESAKDPAFVGRDWLGAGPMGEAILRTWPATKSALDERIDGQTRRQNWSKVLRASVDFWRTHRRSYTNQSIIVDRNIYTANRALELIDPSNALPAAKVLEYLYQAIGLHPWLGSDTDIPAAKTADDPPGFGAPTPLGEHYYLVTRKGLSRELGWVATYGETILHFTHDLAELTQDAQIRDQLRNLERARMPFRYPGVDADGFGCMKLVSEVDNRTAHYPLTGAAYTAPQIREEWWMDVPAVLADDPVSVGAAQQSLADNQYFAYVQSRLKDPDTLGMMRNVDEYETVKALPPSTYRLPMSEGQPDFAWADEEDAILVVKHGDERLFVNLYYRAERAVNSVARIADFTPNLTRLATVRTETQVDPSGKTYTRPDWIDAIRSRGLPPPGDTFHQAWAGETMPIAARPDGASQPKYGDFGPFVGKALLYQLRYGDYFIAMNSSYTRRFDVSIPADAQGAIDLITSKRIERSSDFRLGPLTTLVLHVSRNGVSVSN
jgi:hypothetical protein